MLLDRAQESLRAAELCLEVELVNSAASRAYYAMFQEGTRHGPKG